MTLHNRHNRNFMYLLSYSNLLNNDVRLEMLILEEFENLSTEKSARGAFGFAKNIRLIWKKSMDTSQQKPIRKKLSMPEKSSNGWNMYVFITLGITW